MDASKLSAELLQAYRSIKATPLFSQMSEEQIIAFLQKGVIQEYPANTLITTENTQFNALRVVLSGKLRIFFPKETKDKIRHKDIELATFNVGEVIGAYSILDDEPTLVCISTAEPTQLFECNRTVIESLIQSDSLFGLLFYRNLSKLTIKRLRALNDKRESNYKVIASVQYFTCS